MKSTQAKQRQTEATAAPLSRMLEKLFSSVSSGNIAEWNAWQATQTSTSLQFDEGDFRKWELLATQETPIDLSRCSFAFANFLLARISYACWNGGSLPRADFFRAHLDHCTFAHANLADAYFAKAKLQACSFANATLNDADFRDSECLRVDFSNSRLIAAYFCGARVKDCDFSGADMREIRLRGTDLSEAQGLTTSQLLGTYIDRDTKLPNYLENERSSLLAQAKAE